jgi:poly-gamma-glutamate synthesis protein (capsule biosynthesis protein)
MQLHPSTSPRWLRSLTLGTLVVAAALSSLVLIVSGQNIQSGQVSVDPPAAPRDAATNLALKIKDSFTIASVGDVMIKRPASMLADPAFQSAIRVIKTADVGVGNMEGNLADIRTFDGPLRGMMGSREVAADIKAMGITMMNRANNHVFDSDQQGMFSTIEQLEAVGIVHAGTGKNLEDARAPAFLETPKGRIGIVGIHTPHGTNNAMASYQAGNVGGRPGLNPLQLTTYHTVNQAQLDAIKQIRRAAYTAPPGTTNATRLPAASEEPADRVQLFDVWYKLGREAGTKTFEMNRNDQREILRSIRNGKYLSDFMIATIHAHQGPIEAQQWLFEDLVPDFLIEFAHQTIDNGADIFVGHGPHVLRGVEIYKGKPIFYGLGEFFYQWQHMDAALMSGSWPQPPAGRGRGAAAPSEPAADVSNPRPAINFESMIATSRYEQGKLAEIRLYPISGQYDGPLSQLGIPKMAPPAMAQRILSRVQTLSKPFGTTVAIDGNVGVIRVAPDAPTTAGARRQ